LRYPVGMSDASLLKRLERAADPTSSGRSVYRGEDLESAVVEHLQKMLNTRAGAALTAPDYGMIEISDMLHEFPDAMGIVQRAIKHAVTKYEPRLKNVQVRVVEPEEDDNQLFVYFEVTAQLVHPNGERQPVRFSTVIDDSSNVRVS
jgi:type VI secretion system protein